MPVPISKIHTFILPSIKQQFNIEIKGIIELIYILHQE